MSITFRGRNWKPSSFLCRVRVTQAYKNWREAVFKRDNYTCRICNAKNDIQAHHIIPVRDSKNTLSIFDVNNGITLCKKCHYKTVNREYDFIEQFKNIIENITEKN